MKHLSRILCVGFAGLSITGSGLTARAQDEESTRSLSQKTGAIVIDVIAVSAIYGSGRYTYNQVSTMNSRTDFHSRSVLNSTGENLARATENLYSSPSPSLSAKVLEGTVPGDVVQLKYVAGTTEALQHAVLDLEHSAVQWQNRVEALRVERVALVAEVEESRRVVAGLKGEELGYRNSAMAKVLEAEGQLKSLDKVINDADTRMHNARAQYQATRLNFESSKRTGVVNQRYHIIRDVLVDGRTDFTLRSFFAQNIGGRSGTAANSSIPHLQIVRVQSANSKLVSGSINRVKGGLFAIGLGAAVLVEELTVGAIADSLGNLSVEHFSPATRTVPHARSPY